MTKSPCFRFRNKPGQSRINGVSPQHVAGCLDCQESERVSTWMRRLDEQTPVPKHSISPRLLLFKDRLKERQHAESCAGQPIIWVQGVNMIVGIVIMLWILITGRMQFVRISKGILRSLLAMDQFLVLSGMSTILFFLALGYFLLSTKATAKS